MIKFLLQGLLRDKSRSHLPIMVVAVGVMLSVFMHAYITGIMNDTIEMNAAFSYGHVKVLTKGYADNMSQFPNDMALDNTDVLVANLKKQLPNIEWVERIQFGGLIDVPNDKGETVAQGPVMGIGIDLFGKETTETKRLRIHESMVEGRMPSKPSEILVSNDFAKKLGIQMGNTVTLMASTMYGGMAYQNFVVVGTVSFGVQVLDRGTIIADIQDVRDALDMDNASGEILGFFSQGYYSDKEADKAKSIFYAHQDNVSIQDEFTPILLTFREQGDMGTFVDLSHSMGAIITFVFIIAMSIVLWNAGLLGGIRRYGEFGVRLAMGETKHHVFASLLYESFFVGIIGSIIGTAFGLLFAWLLQEYGLDMSDEMKGSSMMMPTVLKARITMADYYIGFIPGIFSTLLGAALAGIGIYKRKTSQLFKELEA